MSIIDLNMLTRGSAFLGTSSPSVLVREDSHLQRDPNRANSACASDPKNIFLDARFYVGGPDSDTLPVTMEADSEQSPPTELQRLAEQMADTGCVIYSHYMLLKGHGLPLYIPQPSTSHCDSYERQGVSIGDVGVVTSLGDFDRFFNICLPAGHAMNPDVLPDGFYHLDLKPADVQVKSIYAHSPNSHMASPTVWRTGFVSNLCYISEILTR